MPSVSEAIADLERGTFAPMTVPDTELTGPAIAPTPADPVLSTFSATAARLFGITEFFPMFVAFFSRNITNKGDIGFNAV